MTDRAGGRSSERQSSGGLGLGLGLGLGSGLGLGLGLGSGLGLGLGLGSGSTPATGDDAADAGAAESEADLGAGAGIGVTRSYYATPIELQLLPWTLDFTPDNSGADAFPLEFLIDPYQDPNNPLEWTTDDWDPALRFWSLPYDPHLREWLRAADRTQPATLAALEFGGQPETWHPDFLPADPETLGWFEKEDLDWQLGRPGPGPTGFDFIKPELEQLKIYMEDDRATYLLESHVQADGLPAFMVHFIGAHAGRYPWTLELINCGLAMGNVAYLAYKAHYKRVRPSVLRPGLTVPFGPPAHPAFPSGHSFLAHFIALLLLEIRGLHQRLGVLRDPTAADPNPSPGDGKALRKPKFADLAGRDPIASPLLTLAQRIAVVRERIGVHYPSDSFASRHLAAGLWDALINRPLQNNTAPNVPQIDAPTLLTVLERAKAEWPTPWS